MPDGDSLVASLAPPAVNVNIPLPSVDAAATGVSDARSDDVSCEHLRLIARCMSRTLLRHPQLPSFHNDPRAMYTALHDFFTQWSARQQRAAALALSTAQVMSLLQYGESAIRRAAVAGSTLARAQTAAELVAASPLIAVEALTRELQCLPVRVVLTPVAEVLELARFLDDAQQLRTPFGAVNLVHIVAIGASLSPAPDMKTLLLRVAAGLEHHLLCAAIFHEWSLIDKINSEGLRTLSQALQQAPCDGQTVDVVASLLATSSIEGLGSGPADPAAVTAVAPGSGVERSSRRSGSSWYPDVLQERCGTVSPAGMCDGGSMSSSKRSESPVSVLELVEGSGDEASGTVDLEFWRRLCS
ncbi:uncharacterized protein TM35_000132810 [Trypanosoma theileri]|uniref:Uncharacterized protein n=1 Tax=Trypanosoma theileri TaxID=67003 RepID=A0A1X0NX46_9TRYP|nr:uncharacterized protein TM35_000132810 [Trypanosoma theileri]ORC89277.1 hypothetical protein TM35_000132810 [Trypanosoma theileri]